MGTDNSNTHAYGWTLFVCIVTCEGLSATEGKCFMDLCRQALAPDIPSLVGCQGCGPILQHV